MPTTIGDSGTGGNVGSEAEYLAAKFVRYRSAVRVVSISLPPAFRAGVNPTVIISDKNSAGKPSFNPDATVVYCETCKAARLFEVGDSQKFIDAGWPDCCGEPITLISGAQYHRGLIPRPRG